MSICISDVTYILLLLMVLRLWTGLVLVCFKSLVQISDFWFKVVKRALKVEVFLGGILMQVQLLEK